MLPIDTPITSADLKTSCAQCDKVIPQKKIIVGLIKIGPRILQEHFCSPYCRTLWRDTQHHRIVRA